jgi:hypothetical protein
LFKCVFIVQSGFAMVFHLWIYCTLINLMPSPSFPYPFSLSLYYSKARESNSKIHLEPQKTLKSQSNIEKTESKLRHHTTWF